MGLPAFNGFVGEFTILQGAFQANVAMTVFAAFGMVLSAAYLLTFFQKVFLGQYKGEAAADAHGDDAHGHGGGAIADLTGREIAACVPMIVMCFVIGLYATPFFEVMANSVQSLLITVGLAMR